MMASIETPQGLAESVTGAVPNWVLVPALVIADAKAETAIVNNIIASEVRIYGRTSAFGQTDIIGFAGLFRMPGFVIKNPAHTLRIEGNTLTKVVVDKSLKLGFIPPTPAASGSITGLFARMSILDNTFGSADNQWIGAHVISNGNHFIQPAQSQNLRVATAAGASFICIGTSCNFPAKLLQAVSSSAAFRESANLITFLP
jgi:hypothetical protein